MLPQWLSDYLQELGVPEGLGIFIIILLFVHLLIAAFLCFKTKQKAAKWKRQRKLRKDE